VLEVTQTYKNKISAPSRRIIPKVDMYFDGDDMPPTQFDKTKISALELLEETQAESSSPLGALSSNELVLSLDNTGYVFTPTNINSPYHDKLHPGILVEPFLGLEIEEDVFEYVPLGKFRTGDWVAPANSLECYTICRDWFQEMCERDMPSLPVMLNTTIAEMFRALFYALGLTDDDFEIDPNINTPVKIGWFSTGKVREGLQELAADCVVIATRRGKIRVHSHSTIAEAVTTIDDRTQIFHAELPQQHLKTYSQVDIEYYTPTIEEDENELISLGEIEVPTGDFTISNIVFEKSPAVYVSQVILQNAVNTSVVGFTYGSHRIDLVLHNASIPEKVSICIRGKAVNIVSNIYTVEDASLLELIGRKTLKLRTPFIQSTEDVHLYADRILTLVTDPSAYLTAELRGDPALELTDIIIIDDPSERINNLEVLPIRFNIKYDGGAMSMSLVAIKKTSKASPVGGE
jgi:hypothetical protein